MTEMWERFTYYGMRGILILFLVDAVATGGFGLDDPTATDAHDEALGPRCGRQERLDRPAEAVVGDRAGEQLGGGEHLGGDDPGAVGDDDTALAGQRTAPHQVRCGGR